MRKKNLNSKTAGTEIIASSLILKLAENALSPYRSVFSFVEQECEAKIQYAILNLKMYKFCYYYYSQ